jgi:hypothetical protein
MVAYWSVIKGFLKPLATTPPGKKTVAENSSSTKMVTRSWGKKMEVTKG